MRWSVQRLWSGNQQEERAATPFEDLIAELVCQEGDGEQHPCVNIL